MVCSTNTTHRTITISVSSEPDTRHIEDTPRFFDRLRSCDQQTYTYTLRPFENCLQNTISVLARLGVARRTDIAGFFPHFSTIMVSIAYPAYPAYCINVQFGHELPTARCAIHVVLFLVQAHVEIPLLGSSWGPHYLKVFRVPRHSSGRRH